MRASLCYEYLVLVFYVEFLKVEFLLIGSEELAAMSSCFGPSYRFHAFMY